MSLRYGGNPVHRIRQKTAEEIAKAAEVHNDAASLDERYQQLASFVHRTAIVPRERGYMWACICGKGMGIIRDGGPIAAQHAATGHVLEEAHTLRDMLEGTTQERQIVNE